MRNKLKFQLQDISKVGLFVFAIITFSCKQKNEPAPPAQVRTGIIYAKPENIASGIPIEQVVAISSFYSKPENKVKIQFPLPEALYGWQHISKFFPTAQVNRAGDISKIPYAIQPEIGDVSYKNVTGETNTVNSHFEKFPIDAMIVVKGGKVVYERYKTMRPEDKHIWYSISKLLGPTILLGLEEEGKVNIDKPVSTYLTELGGTVWDSVKVREALNMATGLNGTEHDEPNKDSRTNPEQIWLQWAANIGLVPALPGKEKDTWVDVLSKMERRKPAFTSFEYNSINTFVVNRIVERAGGKMLAEQLSEHIWTKLGMENDGYIIVSNSGYSLGFFGMNTTLRDLARYGMLFTPSVSVLTKEPFLTPVQIGKMQKGTHPEMYTKGSMGEKMQSYFPDETGITVNYQWDAVFTDGDMFKSGVGGQGLYVSPAKDIVIAWFCTGTGRNQEETMARAIVQSLK
jgi:CubicO group peptidase (beta-lactamase class C family)